MARWSEILGGVCSVVAGVAEGMQLLYFVESDRYEAMAVLTDMVERNPPHVLDSFESEFMARCSALNDPALIVRAMELYAWFKIAETARYGKFRGFCTPDGRLPEGRSR